MRFTNRKYKLINVILLLCILASFSLAFVIENLKKEFSAICITAVMAFIYLYRTKIALNPPNFLAFIAL